MLTVMTHEVSSSRGAKAAVFNFEEVRLATDLDRALRRIVHGEATDQEGRRDSERELGPLLEVAELLMLRAETARQLVSD
jgi:hypothetical protein